MILIGPLVLVKEHRFSIPLNPDIINIPLKKEQEGILFFPKNKNFDCHRGMISCKYQIIYNLAIIASPHVST
jgi:hypothetical protein